MNDYKTEHRCLLREVAGGRQRLYGPPNRTLQALILAGFLTTRIASDQHTYLELTRAGHRYLSGLWH